MASTNIDLFVDETYLIALTNDEPIPISDEKYADEISLQESIFSSSSTNSFPENNHIDIDHISYDFPTFLKIIEKDDNRCESSQSKQIICGICMETKDPQEIFSELQKCNHTFCTTCVSTYVTSKIKENIALVVCPYPKCNTTIEPEYFINILPKEVFARWDDALCEALILGSEKFYCPYKDCSALMIDDNTETIDQAECPSCRRLFCASCRVRWHVGITCVEYGMLREDERGNDDLMVMNLAKDKQWRRCSNCSYYVEKSQGCMHMTCRCRYEFCYKCGIKWSSTHNC